MSLDWDDAPCGLLRVDNNGRVLTLNTALLRLCGHPADAPAPAHLDQWLKPASRLYYQLNMLPALQLSGFVDEVYLEFQDPRGVAVPVLVNARRDDAGSRWAVMRIEQRGRWEEAVVEARQAAEHESRQHELKSQELERARAELERVLAELKESKWLLDKVAEVLPTCMYCGRVKSSELKWETAIDFLKKNSGFLSHGCCPQCIGIMRKQMGQG